MEIPNRRLKSLARKFSESYPTREAIDPIIVLGFAMRRRTSSILTECSSSMIECPVALRNADDSLRVSIGTVFMAAVYHIGAGCVTR